MTPLASIFDWSRAASQVNAVRGSEERVSPVAVGAIDDSEDDIGRLPVAASRPPPLSFDAPTLAFNTASSSAKTANTLLNAFAHPVALQHRDR